MTAMNPNIVFPNKNKPQKTQLHHRSGGTVSASSISWSYDLRPAKEWTINCCLPASKRTPESQFVKKIAIEAQGVKKGTLREG
ncbi:MAG: hypothetical protein AB7F61_14435 [Desulfobulbus sp.]